MIPKIISGLGEIPQTKNKQINTVIAGDELTYKQNSFPTKLMGVSFFCFLNIVLKV